MLNAISKVYRSQALYLAHAIVTVFLTTTVACSLSAQAQTFTVLHNFGAAGDGSTLTGLIAQARDGNLYGTSMAGGVSGWGTVYGITPTGRISVHSLYNPQGGYPYGGLRLGEDGLLYGTTLYGGPLHLSRGTLFSITTSGQYVILHSFEGPSDGARPNTAPIQSPNLVLHGTTNHGAGTIYRFTSPDQLKTLHRFGTGDDGANGITLIQAGDGNLYGTTCCGGQFGGGTFFTMAPSGGSYAKIYDFTACCVAEGQLVEGLGGEFFGTTDTSPYGTIFQVRKDGQFILLHNFDGSDGATPYSGLVLASDGNLYGMTVSGGTSDYGTIFRVSPLGQFAVLHNFDLSDGSYPEGTLMQHTNGKLYGATSGGGTYGGGTFFGFDVGAPAFVRLMHESGKFGSTVGILGDGFAGASTVTFNGTPATFTVLTNSYLEATVPEGSTTGFVTVTTETGSFTSNREFRAKVQ